MRGTVTGLLLTGLFIGMCIIALEQLTLPPPSGPYQIGTRFLSPAGKTSEARNGGTPFIQIWYPAEPSNKPVAFYRPFRGPSLKTSYLSLVRTAARTGAPPLRRSLPFPVLLFAHRWGGRAYQNTLLAEDLASHGYIVASMNHFSDPALVMSNAGLSRRGTNAHQTPSEDARHSIELWNEILDLWAADERSLLDQLTQLNANPADALHGLFDLEHAGAIGHSFGGAVALRLCGLDPRIRAAINLDGWSFGALKDRTASQPVLIMYEQAVIDRRTTLLKLPARGLTQDEIDRADNLGVDTSLKRFGGYRLYVAGAQHMDFTDAPFLPLARFRSATGPIKSERMRSLVSKAVLDFFDQSLRGQTSTFLGATQREFLEISAESWAGPHPQSQPTTIGNTSR